MRKYFHFLEVYSFRQENQFNPTVMAWIMQQKWLPELQISTNENAEIAPRILQYKFC